MNKKIVEIIFLLVVSTLIIPASAILPQKADDPQQTQLNMNNVISESLANNCWPMFRQNSGNTGYSTSIGPSTNHLKWKQKIPENLFGTTPIVSDDKVFISTNWFYKENLNRTTNPFEKPPSITDLREILMNPPTGEAMGLYCLDTITGEQLWFQPFYAPNDPAIANGNLYIVDLDYSSYTSKLYCLNTENGNILWEKTILDQWVVSPTIIWNDKIYLATLDIYGGYYYEFLSSIYCYDLSGNYNWNYTLPDYEIIFFSAPAVDNGVVSFISINLYSYYEGYIYGINANNGDYLWSQPIFPLFIFYYGMTSPACTNGKVYAVDINIYNYNGYLKCFDAQTGNLQWTTILGPVFSWSTPAVDEDYVYISGMDFYSYNSSLYRIYSNNGTIQWKVNVPGIPYPFFSGGSPICSKNTIILLQGSYYGTTELTCFNKENGMSLWQLPLDDVSVGNPSICDQIVYIVDYSGNVYAIEDVLKIKSISGGFMNVKMVIQNIGDTNLTNINWSISVEGGTMKLINLHKFGSIKTLPIEKSKLVRAFPIFGMGKVYINATIAMEDMDGIQINNKGLVLGPIIIVT